MAIHYIYNAQGYLIGGCESDGVPENSTTLPPIYTVGQPPQFLNGAWVDQSTPTAETWTDKIADRRYTAEVRGFIWNSVFIDTDRVSQPKIASARAAAKDGVRSDSAVWKCGNPMTGQPLYRVTTNAEMVQIGDAAFNYVQACYDREGELIAAVADDTITDAMIDAGWPD
ncbi:DUF4376 domain-containing protein [Pseudomonas sp. DSP3-2-2]|uniref:DUF4376 domain-containing protein n=1 Tax=unclassified Pseudomonas TaxID=196821 RepID=UPI003CF22C8B